MAARVIRWTFSPSSSQPSAAVINGAEASRNMVLATVVKLSARM